MKNWRRAGTDKLQVERKNIKMEMLIERFDQLTLSPRIEVLHGVS